MKKIERKKNEIKLSPGQSMEIGFATSWRRDKDEVFILTEGGPIVLDGKSELFLEISAENIDPIKIQVIPDFKKRTINLVEIIDLNSEKKNIDTKLRFEGIIFRERPITLSDYLTNFDLDVEEFGKAVEKQKKIRNVLILVNLAIFLFNIYMAKRDIMSLYNLIFLLPPVLIIIYFWLNHIKLEKEYRQYIKIKENLFGLVKEK